ncbi:EAL domain-containing protein [Alkalicoccus chagannorensis]|uniref:EAL domain-containing protein n=1 Tax=Alkalicoccus chagannorensis TaxID=427072 RepID=UPI000689062F|nr:EAL domain-containing protein [Alkalicoccus chagannorensis]
MKVTDTGYEYVQVTEEARRLGSLPVDYHGKAIRDIYPADVGDKLHIQYDQAVERGEPIFYSDRLPDGSDHQYVSSVLLPIEDDEGRIGSVIAITNELKEEMLHGMLHSVTKIDFLTQLPNLVWIKEELQNLLESRDGIQVQVLYMNVDRFKLVNELLGIDKGNDLLRECAGRIKELLPEDAMFGRVDGDEFVAVLKNADTVEARTAAERIMEAVASMTAEASGMRLNFSACVGISGGSEYAGSLIVNASSAMVEAKQEGPGTLSLHEKKGTAQKKMHQMKMEIELIEAVERDDVSVVYQPKFSALDGAAGVEALARWHSEEFGQVSPGVFIPIAERSPLIEKLTHNVMEQVCRDIDARPDIFAGSITAVNLSAKLLKKEAVNRVIAAPVEKYGLSPSMFELEITEQMLVEDMKSGREMVDYLRRLGFRVVIDDFGVSYSSLNYLKNFSLDGIKIDKSFIQDIDESVNPKEYQIVTFMMTLASKLGLSVTAEGVETIGQMELLTDLGCEYLQGFYLSRPMPLDELPEAIREGTEKIPGVWEKPAYGDMVADILLETERQRNEELQKLGVLQTDFSKAYDRITRVVSQTFDVPVAFIGFMSHSRQYIKSAVGLRHEDIEAPIPREKTMCTRVIESGKSLVLQHAEKDPMYKDHLLVQSGFQFYASVPLYTDSGHILGTLCLMDVKPRSFSSEDLLQLEEFTYWVMAELNHALQKRPQQ